MCEINVNMSVSIPDEIYEKFLTELEHDGFVFAKFGEYTLVLSMQVHEISTTLTQEEKLENIGAPKIYPIDNKRPLILIGATGK